MKIKTYPLRVSKRDYETLVAEARRRRQSLAELLRDLIRYGLPALPAAPGIDEPLREVWDNLGAVPEVLHDKLPQER